jgi:uncharacterized DUF497 family protein
MEFRWIQWNIDHWAAHGLSWEEAEEVIRQARPPYPQFRGDGKWLVCGRGPGGQFLQVIFVEDDDGTVFVIHGRPLNEREKRRYRRREP